MLKIPVDRLVLPHDNIGLNIAKELDISSMRYMRFVDIAVLIKEHGMNGLWADPIKHYMEIGSKTINSTEFLVRSNTNGYHVLDGSHRVLALILLGENELVIQKLTNDSGARAVILAGGKGEGWGNYLGVPKHLISVRGETLIERTKRLLLANGINDILFVGPSPYDERYNVYGTQYIPTKGKSACEYEILNDTDTALDYRIIDPFKRNIILLGDVWYSDDAIQIITQCNNQSKGYTWITREKGRSMPWWDDPWGELWAISFEPYAQKEICEAMISVKPNSKNIWLHLIGNTPEVDARKDSMIYINDFTTDFDYPYIYEMWKKAFVYISSLTCSLDHVGPSIDHIFSPVSQTPDVVKYRLRNI